MSSKSEIAVSVRGLSKSYTIAHQAEKHSTLAETLLAKAKNPFKRTPKETFWALKDVNFDIKKGEVVGIIGRNGAGKSTLLKILSRITEPTAGQIDLYGRVGSLLEVGTGFHPELTGRENIFLNGAILGMTKAEIRQQFEGIVDFAGVDKFLDTPVKRYSSGMYVRLAFAVAAHLRSEILIVDEVLAVGDAEFQKRCIGKMRDVSTTGRTVVFVSHNMSAVRELCAAGILLQNGDVTVLGGINEVIREHLNHSTNLTSFSRAYVSRDEAKITSARFLDVSSDNYSQTEIDLVVISDSSRDASLDFRFYDIADAPIGYASVGALDYRELICLRSGENQLRVELDLSKLAAGTYRLSLDLTLPNVKYYDRLEHVLSFEVARSPSLGIARVLNQEWGYGSFEIDARLIASHLNDKRDGSQQLPATVG